MPLVAAGSGMSDESLSYNATCYAFMLSLFVLVDLWCVCKICELNFRVVEGLYCRCYLGAPTNYQDELCIDVCCIRFSK